jgi:SprT protein
MLAHMNMVEPITQTQQQQVLSEVKRYLRLAEQKLQRSFNDIPVYFDLKGRAAGMYKIALGKRQLRFNPYLFARYFEENVQNTIPHEVAHYLVDAIYGIKKVRPHGKEWKNIMQLLGAEPLRTHQFSMQGIPHRSYRRFSYQCNCNIYQLTSRRHNMINRNQRRYFCPTCKSELQLLIKQ